MGDTVALIPGQKPPVQVTVHSNKDLVKLFPATWLVIIYLVLLIALEVMSFVLYDVLHVKLLGGVDEPFGLLTAIHVTVWAVTVLYDRMLHYYLHALRICGYLSFFTRTKEVRRVPISIFSLGNASLLLVVAFTGNHPNQGMLSLIRVFQMVVSIEVFICIVSIIIYLVHIVRFNHASKLPDVYQQDANEGFTHSATYDIPDVGFRDSDNLDEILEKQSEMIRYLQQHNTYLGRTIVELTDRLPKDQQHKILASSNIATS